MEKKKEITQVAKITDTGKVQSTKNTGKEIKVPAKPDNKRGRPTSGTS